jgi:hypothetical protein
MWINSSFDKATSVASACSEGESFGPPVSANRPSSRG